MRKVVQLRGLIVQHHLIVDDEGVILVDAGLIGGIRRIKMALKTLGLDLTAIRAIVLTHGHLDHTLNTSKLQRLTGCEVLAPLADKEHINGSHPDAGWSRLAGAMEKAGRFIFRFTPPKVTRWFRPGDCFHGLKVIGLPGHTVGHCGLLMEDEKLLFAGDLMTTHFGRPMAPPRIFNDDHQEARTSIQKAAALNLNGIYLNHSWTKDPQRALSSLIDLADHL